RSRQSRDRPSRALLVEGPAELREPPRLSDHESTELENPRLEHERELPAREIAEVRLDVSAVCEVEHLSVDLVTCLLDRSGDDFGEQALLVGEVLVDGLFRDTGQRCDLVHAGAAVAVPEKGLAGCLEDCRPLAARPAWGGNA